MTDADMIRLCARAMEPPATHPGQSEIWGCLIKYTPNNGKEIQTWVRNEYNPLEDDAQAMAVVKKFHMDIQYQFPMSDDSKAEGSWEVVATISGWDKTKNRDLNRAIVECIAKCEEKFPQKHKRQ